MRSGKCRHAGLNRFTDDFGIRGFSKSLPHNGLHGREGVFYAMIQLINEHVGVGLCALVLGQIHK